MKKDFGKEMKVWALAALTLFSGATFTSCNDEIDAENRFTFKGELISTYLENNPETFSNFCVILDKAKIGKKASGSVLKTLSTYGSYTCFAPTNKAIEDYLLNEYNTYIESVEANKLDPSVQIYRTGITSPYLEELSDSMATEIAKNHIIEMGYLTTDIYEGSFPMSTMNRRFTTVEFITDEAGRVFPLLNNSALIIEQDLEKENGYVQVVNGVLHPSNKLLPELIEAQPAFRIFSDAIRATGIDSILNIYEIDLDYDNTLFGPKFGTEGGTCPYPRDKKQRYTVLIEPDALFNSYGIEDYKALGEWAEKWYGTEAKGDYRNPKNALHQFILYHIIDRQLLYCSSTGPGGFIQENYENKGYSSIVNLNQKYDSYEYYETMLPYTMVKVTKPYTNSKLKQEIIINYAQDKGTACIVPGMEEHMNVIVEKVSVTKEKYEDLADFEQSSLNGILHTIDRILIYNEEEISGNIFNERIRMDASSLFPELTNNEVRWDLQTTESKLTFIPEGFCKYLVMNKKNSSV